MNSSRHARGENRYAVACLNTAESTVRCSVLRRRLMILVISEALILLGILCWGLLGK